MDSSAGASETPVEGSGASRLVARSWFWVPVVPLVVLDLWSKSAVFSFLAERYGDLLPPQREHVLISQPFGFSLVEWRNTGTIWGLWKDFNLALIGARIVAIPVVIWFALKTPMHKRVQQLTFGAILAGAIGNLWDNLTQPDRAVRDFLKFYWPYENGEQAIFPAFNVADACISVGAISLAVLLLREDFQAARAAKKTA